MFVNTFSIVFDDITNFAKWLHRAWPLSQQPIGQRGLFGRCHLLLCHRARLQKSVQRKILTKLKLIGKTTQNILENSCKTYGKIHSKILENSYKTYKYRNLVMASHEIHEFQEECYHTGKKINFKAHLNIILKSNLWYV